MVQEVIDTPQLELHHICAEDLVTLFENPEDLSIYEDKPYSNPHRQLMDDKGPLKWRVPQVTENPELSRYWALEDSQVQILRYTVNVENAPSIHVIESLGFHYEGEQIDEEDGPESIYEISREEFLDKFGSNAQMRKVKI